MAELRTAFEDSVRSSLDTYLAAPQRDSGALADSLRSAFQTFVDDLRTTLSPNNTDDPPAVPVPEETAPTPAEPPPPEGSAPSLEEALASLSTVFDASLNEMLASVASGAALSDPSSPTGHGKAYDKFLQIYNDLRGTNQDTTPPDPDPLEVVA